MNPRAQPWGTVQIRLIAEGRPAHCEWHHSIGWDPRLYKKEKARRPLDSSLFASCFSIFMCVYCVYVHVCMCVGRKTLLCAYVHLYMDCACPKVDAGITPTTLLPYSLKQLLSVKPRAPQYHWFCQLALGIFHQYLCEAGTAGELLCTYLSLPNILSPSSLHIQ